MIKTGHYIWKRAVLLSALLVLAAIWKQSTAFSGFTLKPCEPSQFAGVLTVQRSAEEYRENVDLIAEGTVLGDGAMYRACGQGSRRKTANDAVCGACGKGMV